MTFPDVPDDTLVRITRFETYTDPDPTAYVIGVTVTLPNGRSRYADTQVPFSEVPEGASEQDIVDRAAPSLIRSLSGWAEANKDKPALVGQGETWAETKARLESKQT